MLKKQAEAETSSFPEDFVSFQYEVYQENAESNVVCVIGVRTL